MAAVLGVGFGIEAESEDYSMGCELSDDTPPGLTLQHPTEGLSFAQQFQQCHPFVTVKNTFIDGWASEDEEQGAPMMAAKSCPAPKSHAFEDEADEPPNRFACLLGRLPPEQGLKARQLAVQYLSNPSPDALPAYVWPKSLARGEVMPSVAADLEQKPEVQPPPLEKAKKPLPPHVTPLERRKPELSLGSAEHEGGECRPCAWFWRPQGCQNGEACRHCHLCLQGEVKVRRKSKLVMLRKQGRAAQKDAQQQKQQQQKEGKPPVEQQQQSEEKCSLQLTNLV